MIYLLILLIIFALIVPNKKDGGKEKKRRSLAPEVLKNINKKDMSRALEYLQIKSGMKNATPTEMIDKLARKKNIKSADEFNIRYKMGEFNFMSSERQIAFLDKLSAKARYEES